MTVFYVFWLFALCFQMLYILFIVALQILNNKTSDFIINSPEQG